MEPSVVGGGGPMLHADSASHTRCGCVALDGSNRSSGALTRVGGSDNTTVVQPLRRVPGGRRLQSDLAAVVGGGTGPGCRGWLRGRSCKCGISGQLGGVSYGRLKH